MVSAILMAGYNNKRAVKKYAKNVAEHYGEKFIETGYKPLREFRIVEGGLDVSQFRVLQKAPLEHLGSRNPQGRTCRRRLPRTRLSGSRPGSHRG